MGQALTISANGEPFMLYISMPSTFPHPYHELKHFSHVLTKLVVGYLISFLDRQMIFFCDKTTPMSRGHPNEYQSTGQTEPAVNADLRAKNASFAIEN